jgi:hypothetical protein
MATDDKRLIIHSLRITFAIKLVRHVLTGVWFTVASFAVEELCMRRL